MDPCRPTDVVVVGGYLGSGKTTFVNQLLRRGTGRRTLVLVNDFGSIAIDDSLITEAGDDMAVLSNGCVCCGLSSPLIDALIELRSREEPPELLVVECSGVADPTSVAHHAMIPGYRLEAVVVVVDAETIRGRARDQIVGRTILRQFDAADVVLLNKVDLVDPGQLADLTDWVRDRCDGAVVIPSVRSEVPVEAILGGGFPQLVRSVGDVPTVEHDHVDGVDHDAASWSTTDLVDRSALDHFVASLPDGVIRAKGILRLAEAPSLRHALQVVGRRSELSPVGPWGVDGAESVMVVIGLPGSLVSLDWPVTAGPAPS